MTARKERMKVRTYPRPDYPKRKQFDPCRRRFLRQVGAAAGGVGLAASLGLPSLSHGQSMEVDFSLLDGHPLRAAQQPDLPAPMPSMMAPPSAPDPVLGLIAPDEIDAPDPTDPVEPIIAGEPDEDAVLEDRALWIEPGYLVLMRIARDAEDVTVGGDVDASSEDVSAYIGENLSDYDALHNIDTLHRHEDGVATIVEGYIHPAQLVALHVDHDCNEVCSGAEPDWDDYPLGGIIAPPGY